MVKKQRFMTKYKREVIFALFSGFIFHITHKMFAMSCYSICSNLFENKMLTQQYPSWVGWSYYNVLLPKCE